MRIGFLSDVHGNPVALGGCLEKLGELSVDRTFFLGDVVGYMPDAEACLGELRSVGMECQQGNHEAMMLGELPIPRQSESAYRLADARASLTASRLQELAEWPESRELELDGRRILLVHGSPSEPLTGYVYPDSDLSSYGSLPFDLIVTGNTHRPFTQTVDGVLLANAGSVGLPRDTGNLAAFGVYDTDQGEFTIYRVPFAVDQLLERFEGRLHPSVTACLRRTDPSPEGQLLG
jgi:putative phosphoesterase